MAEPLDPLPPWFEDHGLGHDPFSPEAGTAAVIWPSLRELLDLLQHLAVYGHQLIAVIGPQGAGKRVLQALLMERGDEQWSLVRLGGADISDQEGLLFELLQAWQVNVPVNASLAARELLLRDRLVSLRQAGRVPLLLVSEAERLPGPALRLLCALSRGEEGEGRLQVVLFADEALRDRLEELEGETGFIHWLELPRLEDGEAFTLLRERWRQAGGEELPLDEAQVAELNEAAAGLPGQLLRGAAAELAGRRRQDAAPRWRQGRRLAVGGALLLFLLTALFLWMGSVQREPPQVVTRALELPDVPEPSPPADAGALEATAGSPPLEPPISPPVVDATPPPADEATGAPPESSPPAASPAPAGGVPETEAGTSGAGEGGKEPPAPSFSMERKAPDEAGGQPAAPDTAKAPPPAVEKEPPAAPHAAQRPASATGAARPAPQVARTAPPHRPRTAAWLRGLDPDSYVIQVFGSHDREAALRFIGRYRRQDHFAWFETRHRGRPWYVVVYGHYPDREQARAALARLPASLKKGRPWLRRVGEIQQALRG